MKKVTFLPLLVILCFIIALFLVFMHRQQHPDSVALRKEVDLHSDPSTIIAVNADGKINVNVANIDELCLIPGIGPTLAARIVEYRSTNGPYRSVDDLLNIRGIGTETLNNISQFVCVE